MLQSHAVTHPSLATASETIENVRHKVTSSESAKACLATSLSFSKTSQLAVAKVL